LMRISSHGGAPNLGSRLLPVHQWTWAQRLRAGRLS
jgi:hypothetical protein